MFRNCLSAAWANLVRNPWQSIIAIGGLALGLAAAILAEIVGVNQFSFDHFVPGHDRLYYAIMETAGSTGNSYNSRTPADLAAMLQNNFSQVEAITRISEKSAVMRHNTVIAKEDIYWADPNFFQLIPLQVVYGDLATALARPDGIVIPLATAEKYFGRDDVVGETLELDHLHPMTVRAVIADLPSNASTLATGIFASGLAPFSALTRDAGRVGLSRDGGMFVDVSTLVRLKPWASLPDLAHGASELVDAFVPKSLPYRRKVLFERLDRLHVSPQINPDTRPRLLILGAAAVTILILACMNFVNLSTARSAKRGVEVAIRKLAGAGRGALIVQFLSESVLQVLLALCLAVMLVELSLPAANALLNSGAVFNYWRDPGLVTVLIGGTVVVGILAGTYPALVLSSFRPTSALKGFLRGSAIGDFVRLILAALQFAALIVLLIAAIVVYDQNHYATTEALRVNTDQTLLINMPTCSAALRLHIAALPGVAKTSCSSLSVLPQRSGTFLPATSRRIEGSGQLDSYFPMATVPVGYGFFEFYGLKPVAGRFFRPESGDELPSNPAASQIAHYVINETGARQLGYSTPQAAVGQTLNFVNAETALHLPPRKPGAAPEAIGLNGIIVGVVPDFSLTPTGRETGSGSGQSSASIGHGIRSSDPFQATAYSVGLAEANASVPPALLHVRLTARNIPETVAAIDAAWKQSGAPDPIDRTFLDSYVQSLEIAVLREGQAFAVFAGIAVFLACLGLFALSLFATEQRIKEIGVRKAMGATTAEIVALLLWDFAKPALWANVIAWPLAWWLMRRWLSGFVDHIDLALWPFLAASFAALVIALLTVMAHALLVARQKPVLALRYE